MHQLVVAQWLLLQGASTGSDDDDLVFIIVISFLSVALLLLLLLLLCLLLSSRHHHSQRVDKSSSTDVTNAVHGLHWMQNDTASLIAHEEYMTRTFPGLFATLDSETSTDGLKRRHNKSVGTHDWSSVSSLSAGGGRRTTVSSANFLEDSENSIYHVPIDHAVPLANATAAPVENLPEKAAFQCAADENRDIIMGKTDDVAIATTELDACSEDDYEVLKPGAQATCVAPTCVPPLDLSSACANDVSDSLRDDEKQLTFCRVEETIEIDIPCDSPRSSVESMTSPAEVCLDVESAPASARLRTEEPHQDAIFVEVESGLAGAAALAVRPVSYCGSHDSDYIDMRTDFNPIIATDSVRSNTSSKGMKGDGNATRANLTNEDAALYRAVAIDPAASRHSIAARATEDSLRDDTDGGELMSETDVHLLGGLNERKHSVSGLSMLDNVLEEEERNSNRNSAASNVHADADDVVYSLVAASWSRRRRHSRNHHHRRRHRCRKL